MEKRELIRQASCLKCVFSIIEDKEWRKVRCEKTNEIEATAYACYCKDFTPYERYNSDEVSYLGYKFRSLMNGDYRTKLQWEKAGYKVKEGAIGTKMHASIYTTKLYVYFTKDEVELLRKDK